MWHARLNTLYLHMQTTYGHQIWQGGDWLWQVPTLEITWPFHHMTNMRSRDELKKYISPTSLDVCLRNLAGCRLQQWCLECKCQLPLTSCFFSPSCLFFWMDSQKFFVYISWIVTRMRVTSTGLISLESLESVSLQNIQLICNFMGVNITYHVLWRK